MVPVVHQGQGEAGERQHRGTEPGGIEQEHPIGRVWRLVQAHQVGARRKQLHGQSRQPGEATTLAQAQPGGARAFQRPDTRCRAGAEGQRHGQRGESQRERAIGFGQQALAAPCTQEIHQPGIDKRDRKRTEGQADAIVLEQARLHGERHQRRTEHQRAVHPRATVLRLAQNVQQADDDVEPEEQHEEGLDAGEQFRAIEFRAPGGADAEGEGEAEQVEQAPAAPPGNREHRRVEHGVIGEQRDVVGAASGDQHRREVAA